MLEIINLTKTYDQIFFSPAPVSFKIDDGNRVVFVDGENGSGKTTLVKIITGEEVASSGTFKIKFPHQLSIQYQNEGLLPEISALKNIELFTRDVEILTQTIEYLAISEKILKTKARNLSGGEERKIQIARCLVSKRKFWILDEPTSHIDSNFTYCLLDIVCGHIINNGYLFLISHDKDFKKQLEMLVSSYLKPIKISLSRRETNGKKV